MDKLKTHLGELQARETEGGNAEGIDLEADMDNRRKADDDGQHGQMSRAVLAGQAPLVKDSGLAGSDGQHGQTLKARLGELQARETDGPDAEGTDSNGQHGQTSRAILAGQAPLVKDSGSAGSDGQHGQTLKARLGELQTRETDSTDAEGTDSNGQHGQTSRAEWTAISGSGPIAEASLAKDSCEQEVISRKAGNRNGGEEHAAVSERIEECAAMSENDSGALGKQTDQGSGEAHEHVHPASTLDKNTESIHKTNETDTSGEPANPKMQMSGTSGKGHEDDSGDADRVKTAGIAGDSTSREARNEPTRELVSP